MPRPLLLLLLLGWFVLAPSVPARATDRLCDPSYEDCRAPLLELIRNEHAGIDVAFWFMEDARYTTALIERFRAGVRVRVLIDTQANGSNAFNAARLAELKAAGIPMRERVASGILHWKTMIFAGQNVVEFSGANYSEGAFVFWTAFSNYIDEAIYFTDKPSVVNSFKTRFDDLWMDTTRYRHYANVATLRRAHDTYPKDPELNFPPAESYANRAVSRYNRETQRIDVIMYRITDQRHTNAMIDAVRRGVQVRLITEPQQYRDASRLWHSWNVDRLHMAGVRIKHRQHAGLNHQKSVLLYGQRMTIFGSSNWTSPSDQSQEEHNYFTTDSAMFQWFAAQFERKWNSSAGVVENIDFAPQPPPEAPQTPTPANLAAAVGTAGLKLKWYGTPWAHVYDLYFGTSPDPPLYARDLALGPSQSTTDLKSYELPAPLATSTTYYWRIVGRTMANLGTSSEVWSFTTSPVPSAVTISATVPRVSVDSVANGSTAKLWAYVSNTGDITLPAGAKLWFFVDGPGWSGDHWVGAANASGIAPGTSAWRAFDWPVSEGRPAGSYTCWARVYYNGAISPWSPADPFTVTIPARRARVVSVWPVNGGSVARQGWAKLWAQVTNTGSATFPSGAKVWFYVDGPGWSGDHWVGGTLVNGLAPGGSRWYTLTWVVPASASPGTYTYWARVYSGGPISSWSAGQMFAVVP